MNMLWNGALPAGAAGLSPNEVLPRADDGSVEEARRTRAALQLTARLSAAADALPHDVSERLRVGRMRALDIARMRQVASHASAAAPQRRVGTGWSGWLFRVAAVAPLLALVVGLVTIQQGHVDSQIVAAAEVDAALLGDELPPDAYSDAGFSEFLRTSSAN